MLLELPIPNSVRMTNQRLYAAAIGKYLFWSFSVPDNRPIIDRDGLRPSPARPRKFVPLARFASVEVERKPGTVPEFFQCRALRARLCDVLGECHYEHAPKYGHARGVVTRSLTPRRSRKWTLCPRGAVERRRSST
jgi:hypothetical protein